MSVLTDLLILSLFQTTNFDPPRLERGAPLAHSLNIIRSSWVIMDLEIDPEGKVAVRSSEGVNPFRDMALTSVRQWTFAPARTKEPVDSRVTAVFLFRPRDLFAGAAPEIPKSSGTDLDRPPLPLKLSDPGYPKASIGEGAVMLELRIAQTGSLENVRVVTGVEVSPNPQKKWLAPGDLRRRCGKAQPCLERLLRSFLIFDLSFTYRLQRETRVWDSMWRAIQSDWRDRQ